MINHKFLNLYKISIIFSIVLFSGCLKMFSCIQEPLKNNALDSFIVQSVKGKSVKFNQVEAGILYISKKNRKKILELNEDGDLKYLTAEIVNKFNLDSNVKIKDGNGFCTRFLVPELEDDDSIILEVIIKFPRKVKIGTMKKDIVQAHFQYNKRNSGRIEYIWFIFENSAKNFHIKGNWSVTLYNQDKKILSKNFEVY